MAQPNSRVLIVDDNATVRDLVADHFKQRGFATIEAKDGLQGLELALKGHADVIILDVNMPGMDGFSVCRFLRERGDTTPIIILTDRTALDDKVTGFEYGADDYVAKPFSAVELELRVKALLRRKGQAAPGERVPAGGLQEALHRGRLVIDIEKRTVTRDGELVELTPIEFNILKLLAYSPGKVYTREELLNLIWDTSYEGYKRNIDPHINRLRTKIEDDPRKPDYVLTVWGVGYKFAEE